jgi:hypothetical protein
MRAIYILSGLFLLIFVCLIPLPRHFREYRVQTHGQLVNVQLTYVPHAVGCKIKYSMKFIYAGSEYSKKVGCNFDETHKAGDIVQLKHLEGSDILLFPDENIAKEFFAFGALALFGVFLIIYGSRKKPTVAYNTVLAKKRLKN